MKCKHDTFKKVYGILKASDMVRWQQSQSFPVASGPVTRCRVCSGVVGCVLRNNSTSSTPFSARHDQSMICRSITCQNATANGITAAGRGECIRTVEFHSNSMGKEVPIKRNERRQHTSRRTRQPWRCRPRQSGAA